MSPAKSRKSHKHGPTKTKGVTRKTLGDEDEDQNGPGCFQLLLRVFLWFFGIVLAITLILMTFNMMDTIRFKMMDRKDVPQRFEQLRRNGDIIKAHKLLRLRPKEENAEIVGLLMQDIETLESPFLFIIAERMVDEAREEALFWTLAARLRIEYDIARCKDQKMAQDVSPLLVYSMMNEQTFQDMMDQSKIVPLIQRVLDWDEQHPPAYDPSSVCQLVTGSGATVGEARWPAIRFRIRQAAISYLADLPDGGTLDAGAPQTPEPMVPGHTTAADTVMENTEQTNPQPDDPQDSVSSGTATPDSRDQEVGETEAQNTELEEKAE